MKIILVAALLMVLGACSVTLKDDNANWQQLQQPTASHLDDAKQLNKTAIALYNSGNFSAAELLYQRSLAIREKALGKDHPDVALSLIDLAATYQAQGKYTEAEPLYQRSLAIREIALGKDHPDVASILSGLAGLYVKQGKYNEAEPLLKRSLAISEEAAALTTLSILYYYQGKYNEAESLYQRSLAIEEKALGKDHPNVATSLNNLAVLYLAQGKYHAAEPLYQRSLAIWEKALGKDHPNVAGTLINLAELYDFQGKYNEAEPLYKRGLAIQEKALGKDHSDVAASLNNLAGLYQNQGKYNEAEPLLQRSLAIFEKSLGKDHPTVAGSLNNLAAIYKFEGKYNQAEHFYQRSLAIVEKVLGKDHPDVAGSLYSLALLYTDQGKYHEAEPLHQRSLAIREKALGKDHPDIARSLNGLALLYYHEGKYNEAEPLYQRSLVITENALGKDHPDVALYLSRLAILYIAQDKYQKAEPLFSRSLRIMNQLFDHWLWGADEKTRQSYLQKEEGNRSVYLSFYSLTNTPGEAFYFSLSRKGVLLRIATEMNALAKQNPDLAIQQQVEEFKALRVQLSNLAFSGKADKTAIQALDDKSNTLEMQLSQKVAGFKHSKTKVTPKEVLAKLKPEQSLIDFQVYTEVDLKMNKVKNKQVIALIADKQNGIKLIKLGDFAPIAATIKTYLTAIVPTKENASSRAQTLKQTAQTLYQQLWQPLTPYLQDKKTVYLIPDGDLNLLPFKALQDNNGQFLAENIQLIALSSARDIVLPPLEGKATAAAIFAAPDYGDDKLADSVCKTRAIDQQNIYFCSLAQALNEGQGIDKLFFRKQTVPRAKLFLKAQATEQAVDALTAPKILHLATHGFFLEDIKPDEKALEQGRGLMRGLDQPLPLGKIENPLTRSGLAFVGANLGVKGIQQPDGTDGILTALEVLNLKLEGTDLVTLSACDTGKGEVKIGEGVYSLNRAFQEAGAKAVLSTLWTVDDQATSEFMQKFYARFLEGKPAQVAIQETQNEFMRDQQYSDPFYWAGFVMTGKD